MPSVVKTPVEGPPRALREVDRLTGNPENTGQRRRQVLEGHLRADEVTNDPTASLPCQERTGHHLGMDQETLT